MAGILTCTSFSVAFSQAIVQKNSNKTVTNQQAQSVSSEDHESEIQEMLHRYEKKIYFTQNQGQFDEKILYKADFPMGQASVTKEGMIIGTFDAVTMEAREHEGHQIELDIQNGKPWRAFSVPLKGHAWMMKFLRQSESMTIGARDRHSDVYNYFHGNKEVANVNNYQEVWYNNVYDRVDVRYYPSEQGTLEYDIICKPGFNNKNIVIKFDGIEKIEVDEKGQLFFETSVGRVDFPAPIAYQQIDNVKKPVNSRYIVSNNNELSFELGEYDVTRPLVIDPIALRWATWVNTNSSGDNHGHCIWVDPTDGSIYVVARVAGTTNLITVGAFSTTSGGNLEMIVGKYTEPAAIGGSGTRVWQTYLGGSGDDNPYAMEQGPDGHLYITGYTSSTNFPLIGGTAFAGGGASIDHRAQTTDNIFILKINKLGNSIKSAVIGGNGDDGSFDLRIDAAGEIVICGNHNSNNLGTLFPGTGALNRANSNNGIDALVFKINQDLSAISWMKNYGGSLIDQPTIMVQNSSNGDIFVAGYTTSTNFPVSVNARQSTKGGNKCGFIQKLDLAGNTIWSSYFQSNSGDSSSILCMEFNNVKNQLCFGGITSELAASNISLSGVYDNSYNGGAADFFVCLMDTNQNFVSSTYLGGSGYEVNMMGLNTDVNNDVYVFGYTNSSNFPTSVLPNTPLQTSNFGNNDKVFLKLNAPLSTLIYSSYYGGSGDDYDPVGERGIKFSNCRIYTIVTSKSSNIPLTLGTLNPTRTSTSPYEPGLVVWANPPDLLGNTINDDQTICAGEIPQEIVGSVPSYVLPTIIRTGSSNATYPSLGSAANYQWQISTDSSTWTNIPGAISQNLPGATIGQLFVKTFFRRIIWGDACILAGAADQVVTVKVVSVTGIVNSVICNGTSSGSITANSDGVPPLAFLWSDGQTTQTAVNLTSGNYTVTVTDSEGCSASNQFTITVMPNPEPEVSGTLVFCSGSSTTLDAGAGFSGYNWSTGATSQTIIVSTAAAFTVTVTAANGCTASASATTIINQLPACSITGSNFCQGSSTQLCAATNFAYNWSTGATTQCITVSTGGTYTVTVMDGNGCTSSCSKTVIAYTPPGCAITGDLFYCQGGSTQLCAPAGLTYIWNTGATTQCVTVTAGDYTVTITDANGCSSSCTAQVTARPLPNCAITGNGSLCVGESTQWCAAAAPSGFTYNYLWSTAATTQCITVSSSGTYTVTTTDQYGCSSSCSKTLTVNQLPSCSITGSNFCQGSSTQLCAATNASYFWSTGATTQCITVSTGGTYTVTVSDGNGCTSSCSKTVIAYTPPACAITGDLFYCQGGSTQLCAPAGLTYIWNTGATTQCVTVTAGDYTVTVTDANGCSSSCTAQVTARPLPNCAITGNGSLCVGGSTQWCAAAAPSGFTYNYLWSTAATTQCITVNSSGTYTVTITDQYGCSSSCSKTLTVNQLPACSITGSNFCQGSSTQLCAATNASYFWSTGATTQCITVSTGGTYTVTVSDGNGCTSSCSKTVIAYTPPGCAITGDLFYCQGGSTQLCAPAGLTYIWNTGATTQCVTVTAGDYTVTITDANGCSSSCTAQVTARPLPNCAITGNGSLCVGGSTQWCTAAAPSGFTYNYLWSTAATTQCITVSSSGTYTVTITDQYGCSSSCSKSLSVNPIPACQITGNGSVCSGSSTQWCAPSGLSSYLWSTGATTQCIVVSLAGTYSVTTTNGNGCITTCSKTLTINNLPACLINGNSSVCSGKSTQWCAPGGFASYLWSTGATTQCLTLNTAGSYTVTVTNAKGCTSSCNKSLTVMALPSCQITGNSSVCAGNQVQWCASQGAAAYLWSTGATTQCITLVQPGTYTVTTTNADGCTSVCSKTLTFNTVPSCLINGNASVCEGKSTQWCAPGGYSSYLWSTGATTQCVSLNTAGTYSVTVTNAKGCTSSCNKVLTVNPLPECKISGNQIICAGSSIQWCAPSGLSSYLWSTGATTQCITLNTAGTYTLTTTNATGCTSVCTRKLTVKALPVCQISGNSIGCAGGSVQWCGPNGMAGYLWSTGATTKCVTLNVSGVYTLTVTNGNGCTSVCSKELDLTKVPPCGITGVGSICQGSSTQWCAPAGLSAYLWSTGATTSCITVSSGGVYTVTTTDAFGCTNYCAKALTVSPLPSNAISGNGVICQGQSAILCAVGGNNLTYLWNNGSTLQCRTTSVAGIYTVTVTNSSGCSRSGSKTVIVKPLPVFNISGKLNFNQGQSTIICAPAGYGSYLWNTGNTTNCKTISSPGTYTVTVTGNNGCTSSKSATVTVNTRLADESGSITEPEHHLIVSAYPNPFSSKVTIAFENDGASSHVIVELYNVTGSKIAELFNGEIQQNTLYKTEFDGEFHTEGIYFYRITSGNQVINRKLILIK